MKACAIIANGEFIAYPSLLAGIADKYIITLDGAADKLKDLGIIPHVILGDFDSIKDPAYWGIKKDVEISYLGRDDIRIVPLPDQSKTDLEKAIVYCDDQLQASSIYVFCALGYRMDHHENAIHSLRTFYKKDRLLILQSGLQTLIQAKDETIIVQGQVGDKVGILGAPKGKVSSQGLKYELNNFPLEYGYSESICNELHLPQASLQVTGEALLILPVQTF